MKFILGTVALIITATSYAGTFSVMAYNAENLFDNKHDAGTTDWTYLPLAVKRASQEAQAYCESLGNSYYRRDCLTIDWSDAVLNKKIANIARVIKAFDESGRGPDVIVLEEVENLNVITKLAEEGLAGLGYQHRVLIEGDDTRGIDVGLISKYPVVSAKRHSIFLNGEKLDTRGILQVELNVNGKKVVVFGNHWPSQGNPVSERLASVNILLAQTHDLRADLVVAVGDFNVVDRDSPYPFDRMTDFTDAEAEAREAGVEMNDGTHYYRGEWSSLDRIFVLKGSPLTPNWRSFQILAKPWMFEEYRGEKMPLRYDFATGEGFSDHLPIAITVAY